MLPYTNVDDEIARLKTMIAHSDKPDPDNKHALIESNVWGWRVLYPGYGLGIVIVGPRYKDGFSILSEGLESLKDAVKICAAFQIPYKISDIQDPDPL